MILFILGHLLAIALVVIAYLIEPKYGVGALIAFVILMIPWYSMLIRGRKGK
jgi:hypothetical protein